MTRMPTPSPDAAAPFPPRYRWLNRFAAISLLVIFSLIGLHFDYAHHANVVYAQAVAEAKKRGEPLDLADFDDPKIDAQENGVKYLKQATKQLFYAAPSYAEVTLAENIPSNKILGDSDLAPTAALMNRLKPMYASLRAARLAKWANWQVSWPRDGKISWQSNAFVGYRQAANYLQLAAVYYHTIGNDHEALECIRDMWGISRLIDQQPIIVNHLVAIAIEAMTTSTLESMAPQLRIGSGANEINSNEIEKMAQGLLNDAPQMAAGHRAVMFERALIIAGKEDWLPPYRPYIRIQKARLISFMEPFIAATNELNYPAVKRLTTVSRSQADLIRQPLVIESLPTLTEFNAVSFRVRVTRHLAAAKIALCAYRAEHGGLPPSLDVLVPKYLPAVPVDPYSPSGGALKYRAGKPFPCVYSIFENCIDDNANHAATQPVAAWNQPDLVCPIDVPYQ